MSDIFRELEQGYEAKYKLDEETRFKVQCRANKLFGLWAAEQLGLTPDEAEAYALALIRLDMEKPGHIDVAAKVLADCKTAGVSVAERDARAMLDRCRVEAHEQIMEAYPMPLDTDHVQIGG